MSVQIRGVAVAGPPSSGDAPPALVHEQVTPSASWLIAHAFGRLPSVQVIVGDELVLADVTYLGTSAVSVVLAEPAPGFAVLT